MIRELFEQKLMELADEQTANDILADEIIMQELEDACSEGLETLDDRLTDLHRYILEISEQVLSSLTAIYTLEEKDIIDADRTVEEVRKLSEDNLRKCLVAVIDIFALDDCDPDLLVAMSEEVYERAKKVEEK